MAKPKYNVDTVKRLVSVLIRYPDGVWLSKLAKEAKVPVSTTAYYLDHQLRMLVNEHSFGEKKKLVRIVSLKSGVIERLAKGKSLSDIIKFMKIIAEHE